MNGWNIKIASVGGSIADAERWRDVLVSHLRSSAAPLNCEACEIDAAVECNFDALVLLVDSQVHSSVAAGVVDAAGESGTPVLVITDQPLESGNYYEFAGALVELQSAGPERICALLHGLVHRQREIRDLKAEVALNQRFHGGLEGEIAKIHEELQLAAMVQREFLPRELPRLHGIEFAALWRPTNYVSGDIYDVIAMDDDHIGVFVADAVGHGVPAALMTMVICRSLMTREVKDGISSILPPSEVLARLNAEMIRRQGRTTRFATAVYALIDCRRRTVQLASAGHPAPVLLRGNGCSENLTAQGGLLGIFPDEVYEQLEFELQCDDRLLLYTDGFEQAFPASASDQTKRRMPTVQYRDEFDQLSRAPSAAEMVDTITRRLDDQAGSLHQVDDLTLVCVHAGPLDAHATDDQALSDQGIIEALT